jgi:hypothetical protein
VVARQKGKIMQRSGHIDESLVGVEFRSGADFHLRGRAPRWLADLVRGQPGYRRGEIMMIARTGSGLKRLYVRVAGQWMDASLADM